LYVYDTVRKRYPAYEGWEICEQCALKDGSRVDFYVVKRNAQGQVVYGVVIEAKDKAELEIVDTDQMIRYLTETNADEAIIYVANDTLIPPTVQERADEEDLQIIRTQWRKN
jgi:isopentenyl phosphate kinase